MTREWEAFVTVADRFFGALEAGDEEAVVRCYAPDARIWHNFDQVSMTAHENAATLREFFSGFPTRRYSEVRRHHVPSYGLVQQHMLQLIRADGRKVDWPGCIILQIVGGKILVLEEYIDLAGFSARMA